MKFYLSSNKLGEKAEYLKKHNFPFKTLRDGEVVIIIIE